MKKTKKDGCPTKTIRYDIAKRKRNKRKQELLKDFLFSRSCAECYLCGGSYFASEHSYDVDTDKLQQELRVNFSLQSELGVKKQEWVKLLICGICAKKIGPDAIKQKVEDNLKANIALETEDSK